VDGDSAGADGVVVLLQSGEPRRRRSPSRSDVRGTLMVTDPEDRRSAKRVASAHSRSDETAVEFS
jgi:hypothetical protein